MIIKEKAKTLLGYRWIVRSDDNLIMMVYTRSDSSDSDEFIHNYVDELSRVRQQLAKEEESVFENALEDL